MSAGDAEELVDRIGNGDQGAEAELVQRFSDGLSYMLLHLTGDRSLSEDLHQETFRIVLETLRKGGLREPAKLAGFIRATAKNLSRAEYRRTLRRKSDDLESAEEPIDSSPSQLSRVLIEEDRRLVRRVLEELRSERDRQVLFRYHIAEESKEEICRSLGLESLQFNLVLFRARKRFKELLEKRSGGAEGK